MSSLKLSVTVRGSLERKYAATALEQVDRAVADWIAADAARGIETLHVAVDDATAMGAHGVSAVTGRVTARKMKRAVDALCKRLAPDYLVLFGGDDVVPYFVVANPSYDPSGDDDKEVPTDNPYASSRPFQSKTRPSYLVPDRVVGRIPDMLGHGDPVWFVDYLAATGSAPQPASVYGKLYAICCDEWNGAGKACVEYLNHPASSLLISPPEVDASPKATALLPSPLHMVKCHGSPLDPQFYGQQGSAYPVALTSTTLRTRLTPGTLAAAMCCYGAQVYSPSDPAATVPGAWPLASTYLRGGASGFAGSTGIAWVGPSEMMCADWVVAGYLKGVLGGASIGRAFLEAKQDYLRWIGQQGCAPGLADEKTLIEFVLLGDPSVQPVVAAAAATAPLARGLVQQERSQRRMVRARMADQIRLVLPVRSAAGSDAIARAAEVFEAARPISDADRQAFGLQPHVARVEQLETKLQAPVAAARGDAALAAARPRASRQSIEYYWSGRRVLNGHKQIRLVKVETDTEGNVLRFAVVHSS